MTDLTIAGGGDYYYAHNHLYSPVALLEADGDVVERYEYNAYGKPTIYNAQMTQTYAASQYDNPVLFTGRSYDAESGLYYYRYRTQNTELGRFMQNDPLGIKPDRFFGKDTIYYVIDQYSDGLNIYQYAEGEPCHISDFMGLSSASSWELHVGGGVGSTTVECVDECGDKKFFTYTKKCAGFAVGVGASGSIIGGMNGEKCKPDTYKGVFYEFGVGAGVGSVGISFGGGVVEIGLGIGLGFKATRCEYKYVGDNYRPINERY